MIGLKVGEKPLLRAYSVASANYEDRLEFFSIKVPDGPLTSRLQHVRPGDKVFVGSACATPRGLVHALEQSRQAGVVLVHFLTEMEMRNERVLREMHKQKSNQD